MMNMIIDCGTTNLRVTLTDKEGNVLARSSRPGGVRHTAIDGHNGRLKLESQRTTGQSIRQNAIDLDGERYVGYLSIPVLELELPVMSDWDYEKLKSAPCRQFGSAKTNDLVIAAHNYKKHFARLTTLKQGDEVLFYEVDGTVNRYAVEWVDTLKPTEVERVKSSERDLVLYTCTYGGKARTAVFCGRTNR